MPVAFRLTPPPLNLYWDQGSTEAARPKGTIVGRTTRTITVSIPPEMETQIQELMRAEGRTRSELLREALRRYIRDQEWRDLWRYGRGRASEAAISEEEVEGIVDAYRR